MVKEESQEPEMDEKASIISAIPIFKGLQESQLSDLAEIAVSDPQGFSEIARMIG